MGLPAHQHDHSHYRAPLDLLPGAHCPKAGHSRVGLQHSRENGPRMAVTHHRGACVPSLSLSPALPPHHGIASFSPTHRISTHRLLGSRAVQRELSSRGFVLLTPTDSLRSNFWEQMDAVMRVCHTHLGTVEFNRPRTRRCVSPLLHTSTPPSAPHTFPRTRPYIFSVRILMTTP
jgi:hypothetical protein